MKNPPAWIRRNVLAFGSPGRDWFGQMRLAPDGRVAGYSHPNERTWQVQGSQLQLVAEDGRVTSEFAIPDSPQAVARGYSTNGVPLALLPLITLPGVEVPRLPPLVVNSVPKAGTYFLEAAAQAAGWVPTRIHLGSDYVIDFREMSDSAMHRADTQAHINAEAALVASSLLPGQLAVGHVGGQARIDTIRSAGVIALPLVRDLHSCVESLYHFKQARVGSMSVADQAWRALPEPDRFVAFMSFYADKDIDVAAGLTRQILDDRKFPPLRYEDARMGQVPSWFSKALGSHKGGLVDRFRDGLISAQRVETPTKLPRQPVTWSGAAHALFDSLGLAELNHRMGYR